MNDENQNPNESEEVATTPEEGAEETQPNAEGGSNEGDGNDTDAQNPEEGVNPTEAEGEASENSEPEINEGAEAADADGGEEEETENSSEISDEERKDYEFLKEQMQTRHLDPDETARFDKLLPKFEKVADRDSY